MWDDWFANGHHVEHEDAQKHAEKAYQSTMVPSRSRKTQRERFSRAKIRFGEVQRISTFFPNGIE